MPANLEESNRSVCRIELWPQHLLCMQCMHGGGKAAFMETNDLEKKLIAIKENPDIHIKLVGAFDEVGARTPLFSVQSPEERKRDLDVLQKLGLAFGDVRSARDLLPRIRAVVKDIKDICAYETVYNDIWKDCPLSATDAYDRGGDIIAHRDPADMARHKKSSCEQIEQSDKLVVRAHHLLCVTCFIGRGDNETPLEVDNLYEIWVKIRENPNIPIELIEGPGRCMVCPPCHAYEVERGLCNAACHLRDRKKDLDTMMRIGVKPGDILPAREIVKRINAHIKSVKGLCSFETDTSYEWSACNGGESTEYAIGQSIGLIPPEKL